MTDLSTHIQTLQQRIQTAQLQHQRPANTVTLLAVSKRQPVQAIQQAYQAGLRCFGENQVQEALAKMEQLKALTDIEWHFIGALQSNKTRQIAQQFSWVHGLDRAKIAQRLNDQRPVDLPPLQVCIQVNSSGETTKGGVMPDQIETLAGVVAALPRLTLRGLMALPAHQKTFEAQRLPFRKLHQALLALQRKGFAVDTLSMGMSGDLEAAIAEGATLIRVGTALFGKR